MISLHLCIRLLLQRKLLRIALCRGIDVETVQHPVCLSISQPADHCASLRINLIELCQCICSIKKGMLTEPAGVLPGPERQMKLLRKVAPWSI